MKAMLPLIFIAAVAPSASAQTTFTPPAVSAALVKGVPFSTAEVVGDKFRARFHECETQNTCDGKAITFGCRSDPNRNTALLRLKDGVIFFDAKMGVDADGSPLSRKNAGPTDQPQTSLRYPVTGSPSVDADKVPFIVIPLGGFDSALGIELGDIAAVVHRDKLVFALVADRGPVCKIGEGSIQLHEELGHTVCVARDSAGECTKLKDVGISRDVLYFIFPGSKQRIIEGLTPDNVRQRLTTEGQKLFNALTGSSNR
jgi:Fungal chitosanase of glycosyl hydrolase group 75